MAVEMQGSPKHEVDSESGLGRLAAQIRPLDESAMSAARARQDNLTKPRGSLGRLEDLSILLAGMTGNALPRVKDVVVVVMAADHGIAAEGVSAYPQEVTAQMVLNFLRGGAAINVLARQEGARMRIVDMGTAADLLPQAGLEIRKAGRGTRNFAVGPAMERRQAMECILTGVDIAQQEIERGADLVVTGDMGIGNSTSAAAIAAALSGRPVQDLTGRGTGVDDSGWQRKVATIERGLTVNEPNPSDGLDVLSKVGGFEIAGLTGVILGAAAARRPVVVDGYISTAAAMVAVSLAPAAREYLIAGHASAEQGHQAMLDWLHVEPLLALNMRLGEGSGAVLAANLVRAAALLLAEMSTFDDAAVSRKAG